jgi:hypothetical protein
MLKTIVATQAVVSQLRAKGPAVKRRLYVCCSYSQSVILTVLKSDARMRLVNTEKTACTSDL